MKTQILFILGVACLLSSCNAQPSSKKTKETPLSKIAPLKIGDTVPDVVFHHMLNYKDSTARLSDFVKGKKLLILDFWSTSCSACIELFPHMQSLADRFKNNLQIVLVNGKTQIWHDNEEKINGLLERMKKSGDGNIKLPIVLNSKKLDTLFPWKTIPHEVWIDSKGEVIAITGSREVNAENIGEVISGKHIMLPVKKDIFFNLEHHSLSSLIYGTNPPRGIYPLYSSTLIKGMINGLGGRYGLRSSDTLGQTLYTGWYITNMPLLKIYDMAYEDIIRYPANRIVIEGDTSGIFRSLEDEDSGMHRPNVYSYDIMTHPVSKKKLTEYLQTDLERIFNTRVKNAKRQVKCFVLTVSSKPLLCHTKGGPKKYVMTGSKKYVRNYPLKVLVRELDRRFFKYPLINETHLNVNVDIDFPESLSERSIIQTMKREGFEIYEDKRVMNVAVISIN